MHQPKISVDNDRGAAVDILLLIADSRAGGREYDRALDLLAHAEDAAGPLSPEYELKRHVWQTR
jgi:hypothetical protein